MVRNPPTFEVLKEQKHKTHNYEKFNNDDDFNKYYRQFTS